LRANGGRSLRLRESRQTGAEASDRVKIYSSGKAVSGKETFALLGPSEVEARWGVPAAAIPEILALTGDTSDNIHGVPGIGGKTAAQLIREHGTVHRLLENLSSVKADKLRDKLTAARETILNNRLMVALDEDLPLPTPWNQLQIRPDYETLLPALRDCEFKGLLKEVEEEAARITPSTPSAQGDLFS